MANITKREFDILDLSGQRYLEWRVNALAHLKANGLENTIADNNTSSSQQKAKAIIFLRHHLHETLQILAILIVVQHQNQMLSKVVLADTLNVDAEITATKGRTGAIKIQMDHPPKKRENSNHHRLKLMKSQNQVVNATNVA
ncbi:unnamed protein product [Cuscuta campestris]|uniref:Uncharacterized protein n=1 Tax=Cuscuta campestris TaxID=132261 RepID=A0A484KAY4_9ASTE|nr:unnamed protein product [Cuscuta campestris]